MTNRYPDPELIELSRILDGMSREEIAAAVEEAGRDLYWEDPTQYASPADAIAELWADEGGILYDGYQRAESDAVLLKGLNQPELSNEETYARLLRSRPDTVGLRIEKALEARARRLMKSAGPEDRPASFEDAFYKVASETFEGRKLYDFMRSDPRASMPWSEARGQVAKSSQGLPQIISLIERS